MSFTMQIPHAARYAFGVVAHLMGHREMPMSIRVQTGPTFTVPGWEPGMAGGATGRSVRVRLGYPGGVRADVSGEENDDSHYGTTREFTRCTVVEYCAPIEVEGTGPDGWPLPPHTRRRRVWTKGALPDDKGWGWSLVSDETYAPAQASLPARNYRDDDAISVWLAPAWLAACEAAAAIPGTGPLSSRQVSACLRAGGKEMSRSLSPLPGVQREARRWQQWFLSGGRADVRRRHGIVVPDMRHSYPQYVRFAAGASGLEEVGVLLEQARKEPGLYLGQVRQYLDAVWDRLEAAQAA